MELSKLIAMQPLSDFEVELTEEQIRAFWDQGYTSVDRITTDEEVDWLREIYDKMFNGELPVIPGALAASVMRPVDRPGSGSMSRVLRPELWLPELCTTTFWRNGQRIAAQLLRSDPELIDCWGLLMRKPANDLDALPWHQDEAYWETEFDYEAFTCWLPLDPATIDSGCLKYIPGSHKGGIRPHRFLHDDPTISALTIDNIELNLVAHHPVPVGGAALHHCRTVHGSTPNKTSQTRRAYMNEWQLVPRRRSMAAQRPWIEEGKVAQLRKMGVLAD